MPLTVRVRAARTHSLKHAYWLASWFLAAHMAKRHDWKLTTVHCTKLRYTISPCPSSSEECSWRNWRNLTNYTAFSLTPQNALYCTLFLKTVFANLEFLCKCFYVFLNVYISSHFLIVLILQSSIHTSRIAKNPSFSMSYFAGTFRSPSVFCAKKKNKIIIIILLYIIYKKKKRVGNTYSTNR